MTITREVHSGMEVFALDIGKTEDVCDKCAFSTSRLSYLSYLCDITKCGHLTRPDGREVYFLRQDDLRAQALFHSQEQP